jgi:hypothetical protein
MPVATRKSFYDVVTAAVADIIQYGFDSEERVNRWLERIDAAARASLIPEAQMVEILRTTLARTFRRATALPHLKRIHQGVSTFTLANVKPKLRAELQRHIMASAQLIKLNRMEMIAQTKRRFAGWASSIPPGGTEVAKRAEVKDTIRRGMSGLSFVERRCLTDQGLKLVSSINSIIAADGGAIAMRWHHVHQRGGGYTPRPEHVARDKKVYLIRDSWAHARGLVKPGPAGYLDQITQPAEEVSCRCSGQFLYSVGALPADMVTAKGREQLAAAQKTMAA